MKPVTPSPKDSIVEAVPTNFLSTTFSLQQSNRLLGEFAASLWRDRARLEVEDGTYELYREGLFTGDFVLEKDGKVVAIASKPSAFRNRFEMVILSRQLVLQKMSPLTRRFGLFDGDKQVGGIYPLGMVTRRSNIDLPADWPLPIRVFVFWLAFLIWKRQNAAAS